MQQLLFDSHWEPATAPFLPEHRAEGPALGLVSYQPGA